MHQILLIKNGYKKSLNHVYDQSRWEEISYFSFCQMTPPTLITKWETPQGLTVCRPRKSEDELLFLYPPRAVLWGADFFFHKNLSTNLPAIHSDTLSTERNKKKKGGVVWSSLGNIILKTEILKLGQNREKRSACWKFEFFYVFYLHRDLGV